MQKYAHKHTRIHTNRAISLLYYDALLNHIYGDESCKSIGGNNIP